MTPEHLQMRCCMCPNIQKNDTVCPGIPGTLHHHDRTCRFVKCYIDERGWKYRVMCGIGNGSFKARYQKPEKVGSSGWKGVTSLPWKDNFDAVQSDLNKLAQHNGWEEWEIDIAE